MPGGTERETHLPLEILCFGNWELERSLLAVIQQKSNVSLVQFIHPGMGNSVTEKPALSGRKLLV